MIISQPRASPLLKDPQQRLPRNSGNFITSDMVLSERRKKHRSWSSSTFSADLKLGLEIIISQGRGRRRSFVLHFKTDSHDLHTAPMRKQSGRLHLLKIKDIMSSLCASPFNLLSIEIKLVPRTKTKRQRRMRDVTNSK